MNRSPIAEKWLGSEIPYEEAHSLQDQLVALRVDGNITDTVLLLEHAPVFTIGRTRDQSSLRDSKALPHPVIEINRGGQATYHGPGQLVGYPIIDLRHHGKDLHAYLRTLEDALIRALAEFEIDAARRKGLTGVWVADRKIASIGVGVRKWITMHGFALNVTPESLPPFQAITPCGLEGVAMTCLHHESRQHPSPQEVGTLVHRHLADLLGVHSSE